jgi:hypothetical protein
LKRDNFINGPGKDSPDGRLHKYKEACRVMAEIQKHREVLQYMTALFGEVEDKINHVLLGLPLYELVYGFKGDSAEAYIHDGVGMKVSFKLRDTNTTLVYQASLSIGDVFELTEVDLKSRIEKSLVCIRGHNG